MQTENLEKDILRPLASCCYDPEIEPVIGTVLPDVQRTCGFSAWRLWSPPTASRCELAGLGEAGSPDPRQPLHIEYERQGSW